MKTAHKRWTLAEIMEIVRKAYDHDGRFPFDEATGKVLEGCGDGLLEFIVREIVETYEPNRRDSLAEAQRVIDVAGNQLQSVSTALWWERDRHEN